MTKERIHITTVQEIEALRALRDAVGAAHGELDRLRKLGDTRETLDLREVDRLHTKCLRLAMDQERRVPTRLTGIVLDHWESLPNDLRTDPGFEKLDMALAEMDDWVEREEEA